MTDAPSRRRRGGAGGTVAAALTMFLAVMAVLSMRLSAGADPVAHPRVAAVPKVVVRRKLIVKHEIVNLPATAPPQPAVSESSPSVTSYPATTYAPPVTRTSGVP